MHWENIFIVFILWSYLFWNTHTHTHTCLPSPLFTQEKPKLIFPSLTPPPQTHTYTRTHTHTHTYSGPSHIQSRLVPPIRTLPVMHHFLPLARLHFVISSYHCFNSFTFDPEKMVEALLRSRNKLGIELPCDTEGSNSEFPSIQQVLVGLYNYIMM